MNKVLIVVNALNEYWLMYHLVPAKFFVNHMSKNFTDQSIPYLLYLILKLYTLSEWLTASFGVPRGKTRFPVKSSQAIMPSDQVSTALSAITMCFPSLYASTISGLAYATDSDMRAGSPAKAGLCEGP